MFRLQWPCGGGLGVARTSLFLVVGWFNIWQRHAAAALSAMWTWSLPVCACVYSLCVLCEGNLITCVYASTEKVFSLLFFRILHWLLPISKFICSLTLLGEMRPPVSASTGFVSAVIRRSWGGGRFGPLTWGGGRIRYWRRSRIGHWEEYSGPKRSWRRVKTERHFCTL